MKQILCIAFLFFLLMSCTKQVEPTANSVSSDSKSDYSVAGKWHIGNSLWKMQKGETSLMNREYTGTQEDYFDFKEDGNLLIHEGLFIRQLYYKVGDKQILLYYNNALIDSIGFSFASKSTLNLSSYTDLGFGESRNRAWNLTR